MHGTLNAAVKKVDDDDDDVNGDDAHVRSAGLPALTFQGRLPAESDNCFALYRYLIMYLNTEIRCPRTEGMCIYS